MELSILVPRSELTLSERLSDFKDLDFLPYDGPIPFQLDFDGNMVVINHLRKLGEEWDIPYNSGSSEYLFIRGGREKVVGILNPSKKGSLYGTIEKSAGFLGIPVIKEPKNNLRSLYGEVHLIDTCKEHPKEWEIYGLDSRAIIVLLPAKGYLEQDCIQQLLRGSCPNCSGNGQSK